MNRSGRMTMFTLWVAAFMFAAMVGTLPAYAQNNQTITLEASSTSVTMGADLDIAVKYECPDTTGSLGITIHYDSSKLELKDPFYSNFFETDKLSDPLSLDDTDDTDSDANTDKLISFSYMSLSNAFPSGTTTLADLHFTSKVNTGSTSVNVIKVTGSPSHGFVASPLTINFIANSAPVANAVSLTVTEDETKDDGQLDGSDPDGDALTYTINSQPAKGTVNITDATAGTFTYTPNENEYTADGETDDFTYVVNDGTEDSNIATVSVTITPVDDPPVAAKVELTTDEDVVGTGSFDVAEPDGDDLTYEITAQGSNGTAAVTTGGEFTYTPNENFSGADSFSYQADDGVSKSNTATVSVTINAVNDAPTATAGALAATLVDNVETPATGQFVGEDVDGDTLTFTIEKQGEKGQATITNAANGEYSYKVNTSTVVDGDSVTDTITFKVSDGTLDATADVTVTITTGNKLPVVTAGTLTAELGVATSGTLPTATDEDTDDTHTYAIVTPATKGIAAIVDAATGTYTYTPLPTANDGDTDTFTFKATDSKGGDSNEATVTVSIIKPNIPPVAQDMDLPADPSGPTTGTLLATDEDGQIKSYAITQPTQGMLTLTNEATGEFRLNAFGGATGTDSFTFTATDDDDAVSAPATVNIIWGTPQEPPVPQSADAKCKAGESVSITLMATDPEGDPLTFAIDAQPTQGTVTIAGDVATYTANATATGTDTFTFKANDGMVDSATAATVTISIVEDIFDISATGSPEVGGAVAIDPADGKVEAGGDAKITVTIADGYKVASVTDNGAAVTLNADNTYNLTAVDGAHEIIVIFGVIAEGVNSADMNGDFEIQLSELLRVQQIYTIGAYSCGTAGVEDGFVTGDGDQTCTPHAADYNPQNWKIELSEFLRIIQFYTMLGYHVAPEGVDTEDGFVAGPGE